MRVPMLEMGGDAVLAGADNGKFLLSKLITLAVRPASPSPVYFDFAGVTTATGSYLREALLGFRAYGRNLNLIPVVANPAKVVLEELQLLLESRNESMLVCRLDTAGVASDAHLVGGVDKIQRATLQAVQRRNSADAITLAREEDGDEKLATRWNNRLAKLAEMGLLVEERSGRTKKYRLLMEVH